MAVSLVFVAVVAVVDGRTSFSSVSTRRSNDALTLLRVVVASTERVRSRARDVSRDAMRVSSASSLGAEEALEVDGEMFEVYMGREGKYVGVGWGCRRC